ncbi:MULTISPECIES: ATP-binding protein [Streptomyces]|uniref:ATP-binding protein n=1 Tax=Streptomyces lonegramiae TaxID=3075524 RepID=A0ABU2XG91_9ACTN|nr:ATP-binding protein [Streptomyces sp. DSM 41529]MDT0544954.1 ATP-binding protein [Streptomyces sp. DSM 41529]
MTNAPTVALAPPPGTLRRPARRGARAADRGVSWVLPSHPSSVSTARRLVLSQLAVWALAGPTDDAELLVSEVVTNALRYTGGPVRLTLCLCPAEDALRCEVEDADPTPPCAREACEDDEGGRGLYMIDLLARCWGSQRTGSGKTVWFELHIRPGAEGHPDAP